MLRADLARAMPRSDPGNRALHIGCGAALCNLRVAAAHPDLAPDIRVLPDPQDELLLAAVHLADPGERRLRQDDLARLHEAIRQRHTSRRPFAEKDIPEDVQAALRDAAARESAVLLFPGPWHAETVLDLVRDAESRDAMDPGARADLIRWTRLGAEVAHRRRRRPRVRLRPAQTGRQGSRTGLRRTPAGGRPRQHLNNGSHPKDGFHVPHDTPMPRSCWRPGSPL
ncbi:hypothetical protein SGFS_094440 [Streptomyces graminofaciens]|uniref:Uncharacterized protein n=1 Tax=Streptomyces graminofaciens TaxID=68212 RepID=A0ABN5VZW3_9ACTN|nr:hypothetical protein SGFS_094440 [Streptomyces graminofaciens]